MTIPVTNILKEKRKRFQSYTTLDFLISMNTFFDFFSKESFNIFLYTLYLYKILKIKKFSYNLFFISCIEKGVISKEFLNNNNLILEKFLDHLEKQEISKKENTTNQKNESFILLDGFSSFDFEKLNTFLNKLIENSQKRFKTPLISEEIFLITLFELIKVEEKPEIFFKTLSKTSFLNLRYKLLKKLHNLETILKIKTSRNLLFFSYLSQTQLSSFESTNLLCTADQKAETGIVFFRNKLILECLKINIAKELKQTIYENISSNRKYSFH